MTKVGVQTVQRLVAAGVLCAGAVLALQSSHALKPEKSVSSVNGVSSNSQTVNGSAPLKNSDVMVNGRPVPLNSSGDGSVTTPNGSTQVHEGSGSTSVDSTSNDKGTNGNSQNTQVNLSVQNTGGASNTSTMSNGYSWSNNSSSYSSDNSSVFSSSNSDVTNSNVTP